MIVVLYKLPFGSGQSWGNHYGTWINHLVSGWSLSSISPRNPGFRSLRNSATTHPTTATPENLSGHSSIQISSARSFCALRIDGLIPLHSSLRLPAAALRQSGRRCSHRPRPDWDFSVLKDTRITERFNLQFRAEIFNLLNRADFNTPNLIVFTPPTAANPTGVSDTTGTITSSSTTARQVQFGLKLLG